MAGFIYSIIYGFNGQIVEETKKLLCCSSKIEGNIEEEGFRLIGAHTDSPGFRIKPYAEMIAENNYVKLKGLKSVNLQFSAYIKMYAKVISGWDGNEDTKPRSLLQELGTNIIRNKIDNEFFIKRIICDIKVYSYYCDVITISDARLPLEMDSIASEFNNVYKISIERPNFNNNLNNTEKKHITEVALDNYDDYDYKLVNDGTIEDLNKKIIKMVDEVLK